MSAFGSVRNFWSKLFGLSHFHVNMNSLKDMNTSNGDFEKNKSLNAQKVNKTTQSLSQNNDVVASILKAFKRGVVGNKITIQSRTEKDKFNTNFEKYIKIWSKKGNCEITGRYARGLAERSLIGYYISQGGFILRHHINKAWKIPYKFEIIPLSMIDYAQNDIKNTINGLEINKHGEITGIHIFNDTERTNSSVVEYENLTLFIIPEVDATQYTGMSSLAPVLATLDYLTDYSKEELKAAKHRASGSIIIKTHLYNEILKIKKESVGHGKNISEQALAELYQKFQIKGGLNGANYIPSDDDVTELKSSSDTIFEALDNSSKRTISAGVGLSTQTTVREMPSSYNAALLNAQMDDAEFGILFEDFVELAWREVIEVRLLNALVMFGKLKPKGYWANPDNYRNIEFIRPTSAHIDPYKAEKAISESIANQSSNLINEISKKGKDWQSTIRDNILVEVYQEKMRTEIYKENGMKYKGKEDE